MGGILVTGANGFLGSHVLAATGGEPFVSAECDLRDPQAIGKIVDRRPETIIHCAGNVGGIGWNQAFPASIFADNMLMGVNVIQAAIRCRARLVMIGTVCSYPADGPFPLRPAMLWQGYPEATNAPYGVAKRALITLADAAAAEFGISTVTVIPANLYGPWGGTRAHRDHVIPAIVRKMAEERRDGWGFVTLWGTGQAEREFLHVRDAARYIAEIAASDLDGVVNIGSGDTITIATLAERIAGLMGMSDIKIEWNAAKPDGQRRRIVDCRLVTERFGVPRVLFHDGLAETVKYYAEAFA